MITFPGTASPATLPVRWPPPPPLAPFQVGPTASPLATLPVEPAPPPARRPTPEPAAPSPSPSRTHPPGAPRAGDADRLGIVALATATARSQTEAAKAHAVWLAQNDVALAQVAALHHMLTSLA